eukprot:1158860-Pelagomonas_calceolata.AAC.2
MHNLGRHLASLRQAQQFRTLGQCTPAVTQVVPCMTRRKQFATDAQDGSAPSTSGRSWEQASTGADQKPLYSAHPLLEDRLLLRDFIQNSLYHPTKGYFNRPQSVVGHLQTPIDHWKLYCAEEWRMLINKKYKELEVSNSSQPANTCWGFQPRLISKHASASTISPFSGEEQESMFIKAKQHIVRLYRVYKHVVKRTMSSMGSASPSHLRPSVLPLSRQQMHVLHALCSALTACRWCLTCT